MLEVAGQADFGAGIYRGRESPDNAAYDLLNCLIDDEGQPFRRGGSAYKSVSNAGLTMLGLAAPNLAIGQRIIGLAEPGVVALDASNAPVTVETLAALSFAPYQRLAVVGGLAWGINQTGTGILAYGGARATGSTSAGTVAINRNSTSVSGTGTAFGSAPAGAVMAVLSAVDVYVVAIASIGGATSATLAQPWPFEDVTGLTFTLQPIYGATLAQFAASFSIVGAAGTLPRLYIASKDRVAFTQPGKPLQFTRTSGVSPAMVSPPGFDATVADYHVVPDGSEIIGLQGRGGSMLVFTTSGVWEIQNIDFDTVDDQGNIQQSIVHAADTVLQGNAGIATWRDMVIVPAIDNIWAFAGGAPEPIGDPIRALYLSYVNAGYQVGVATVHRGHYFLPIRNGNTLVDVLVCRLDRGAAWTRWNGHGAALSYAQQIGVANPTPKLYAAKGLRITDLSAAWSPSASNASEADATTHALDIITRDLSTPGGKVGSTTQQIRARYEATAAGTPAFTMSYARGPEAASFSSLGTALDGAAASDGLDESVWPVRKKAPAIRFRLQSTSALSTFTLRSIEARYTQSGAV